MAEKTPLLVRHNIPPASPSSSSSRLQRARDSNSNSDSAEMFPRQPARRNRLFAIGLTCAAIVWFLVIGMRAFNDAVIERPGGGTGRTRPGGGKEAERKRVPLEAHVMSKCPDTKACLKELVLPAMMKVENKVDFTLSYLGTPTENDGVECRHGPEECMGNIIELCAARIYPEPRIYLGFTMCLTKDYQAIPEKNFVEDCALEHGIDFQKLNNCASSEDGIGIEMLRKSVKRTADAGVTLSCTVRLNNEIYCIHDDGGWKDCPNGPGVNDLVVAIEKLYHSS